MMTRHGLSRSLSAALALVAAFALAACSSSGGGGSGGDTSSGGAGDTGGATQAAGPSSGSIGKPTAGESSGKDSVTDYLKYTKGKAGKADSSLPPVVIGWVNQQGGQVEIGPKATDGAQMAVKYINNELGGVQGHPVKLKTCFVKSSAEEGATCAQKMLADKQVSVIATGAVATGIQSFFSTLNGAKPVIDGVAASEVDTVQNNAVIYFGDPTHVMSPLATYAKTVLHASSAAMMYPNIPGQVDGANAIKRAMKKVDIPLKAVTFDPSSPDLIGPVTSAGATSADMVIPFTNPAGCVGLAKALKQLGVTDPKMIVSSPQCLSGQVAKGLGGDFAHWTYSIASALYQDTSDPAVQAYRKVTDKYTDPGTATDPWTIVSFSEILTIDRFLNELGVKNITPAAVLKKAKSFTGPVALGAPELNCGKYPKAPAVCNDRSQFYQYDGDNKWTKVAGWLQSP